MSRDDTPRPDTGTHPVGSGAAAPPGFTGGQYSLLRVVLGAFLSVQFLVLTAGATGAGAFVPVAGLLAVLAGVALALGWMDRVAAVVLLLAGVGLSGSSPLLGLPAAVLLAFCLIVHLAAPARPYGSLAAVGRDDPDGGWRLPPWVPVATWTVLAAGHGYSGIAALSSPGFDAAPAGSAALLAVAVVAELAFAALCAVPRLRPWLWFAAILALLALPPRLGVPPAGFGAALLLLHLFAFDPRWLPPSGTGDRAVLYYDGDCGLCHRWVRFVLAEDHSGAACSFAPLQDEVVREVVPDPDALPDSILLHFADGRLLVRSTAVRCLMQRLGGWWRLLATAAAIVPRPLLDLGYRAVARVRRRVFRQPPGRCPIIPAHLRGRFVGGLS